ncbi:MAG TPA: thiaminase II [Candidatus Glassbacteria bacterium]|nr:thiaminase II [Candidatus Glassbacteria bacterium]
MDFTRQMADYCGDEWKRMHTHPFVEEIGRGTLARDKYIFYLEQDYVYLIEFCRLLAILTAKSPDLATMTRFKDLLKGTLEFELDLHKRTCADFGVDEAALEQVKPTPYCLAYTSFLLGTAYGGSFADGVAALLPCAWGYYEVGCRLAAAGLPGDQYYADWIRTYSADEMKNLVEYLRGLMNHLAAEAGERERQLWKELFERSVHFEVMFWEMGYHKLTKAI